MDHEIELAPLGQAISARTGGKGEETEMAKRAGSIMTAASDGRKRSKLRLFSIVTALFVRSFSKITKLSSSEWTQGSVIPCMH